MEIVSSTVDGADHQLFWLTRTVDVFEGAHFVSLYSCHGVTLKNSQQPWIHKGRSAGVS